MLMKFDTGGGLWIFASAPSSRESSLSSDEHKSKKPLFIDGLFDAFVAAAAGVRMYSVK